ncbi:hypothetical protein A2U01_0068515, partial [Trifolium medium]|nr:hypothetical protein [Trifolium medium]
DSLSLVDLFSLGGD